ARVRVLNLTPARSSPKTGFPTAPLGNPSSDRDLG
ncbi:hypothetical protein CCACVL1_23755, partial [Corchorus capsularis]